MLAGEPVERDEITAHVPSETVDVLVQSGIAEADGTLVTLVVSITGVGGVLVAVPPSNWGPHDIYVGPDALYLVEAVCHLAPDGLRAADLGTGTGVLSANLMASHRVVVATDIHRSLALTAAITMALNDAPTGHVATACVTDVAGGLRRHSFDLVGANAPWVPVVAGPDRTRELYSYGGETGIELPRRFLHEGAALLRAGGVAITLALDMELESGQRPLRRVQADLEAAGYLTAMVPTPWSLRRERFVEVIRERQPAVVDALHVAVVVARPHERGDKRDELFSAVDALRERWE
jgi:hypothetical protein